VYGSGMRVHTYDVWVLREEHGLVRRVLSGRTVRRCLTYDTVAYGSGMWVHTYGAWVLREEHSMVRMPLTERAVCVFQASAYIKGR
jgi:hypothetical protein